MTTPAFYHRGLDRALAALGIDPSAWRQLVHVYLLMDFRNQAFARATASGPKALVTPLFWVVGQNLLLSMALSALLFARVDAFFFTMLSLGASMFVMASAIIVEFNEVVLDADDHEVVGHLPIPARTFAAARLTNLLGYVLLITVSLNVFPAIVGAGLRDVTWFYAPAYLAMALLGNLAIVAAIIIGYLLLGAGRPSDGAKEILAWNQIILILVVGYGSQLILRDVHDRFEMAAYQPAEWIVCLPPAWLAWFVDSFHPAETQHRWWILAVATLVTFGLWWHLLRRLTDAYSSLTPGHAVGRAITLRPLAIPGEPAGAVARWLTRPFEERCGFWLCNTMLRRDHNLRMRSWPSLGMVVAVPVLGLATGQFADPLSAPGPASILSLVAVYALAVPIPTIFYNLRFSRDHAAAWTLAVAPIADRLAFTDGLRKAVLYRILLPVAVALAIVLAVAWREPLSVALHVAAAWLVVLGVSYVSQAVLLGRLPFAEAVARGETFGPIALFASLVGGVTMMLTAVHYLAAQQLTWLVLYLIALVVAVAIVRWVTRGALLAAGRAQT